MKRTERNSILSSEKKWSRMEENSWPSKGIVHGLP